MVPTSLSCEPAISNATHCSITSPLDSAAAGRGLLRKVVRAIGGVRLDNCVCSSLNIFSAPDSSLRLKQQWKAFWANSRVMVWRRAFADRKWSRIAVCRQRVMHVCHQPCTLENPVRLFIVLNLLRWLGFTAYNSSISLQNSAHS